MRRDSFERFYYEEVSLEGCGCAEYITTRLRDLDGLAVKAEARGICLVGTGASACLGTAGGQDKEGRREGKLVLGWTEFGELPAQATISHGMTRLAGEVCPCSLSQSNHVSSQKLMTVAWFSPLLPQKYLTRPTKPRFSHRNPSSRAGAARRPSPCPC